MATWGGPFGGGLWGLGCRPWWVSCRGGFYPPQATKWNLQHVRSNCEPIGNGEPNHPTRRLYRKVQIQSMMFLGPQRPRKHKDSTVWLKGPETKGFQFWGPLQAASIVTHSMVPNSQYSCSGGLLRSYISWALLGHGNPRRSNHPVFEVSSPKKPLRVWCLGYLDPLG